MTSTAPAARSARKVFVIGATGGVGHHLVPALIAAGHAVTALHRAPAKADALRQQGAEPVQGDVAEDGVDEFAKRLAGHDAVIIAAGAGGGNQVDPVDRDGPGKIADAAAQAGVRRLLLVSVIPDAWRGHASPGEDFEHYMAAKRTADVAVAATDLDWLLVRPGTLADDDATGTVTAGPAVAYGQIPRVDVASFLAAAVFAPGLNRTAVEVVSGGTPIPEAVAALVPRAAAA